MFNLNVEMNKYEAVRVKIFVNWMRSYIDGFSAENAKEEIDRLSACATVEDYKIVSRVGASFTMNRAMRVNVWGLWDNAGNHAMYEISQK